MRRTRNNKMWKGVYVIAFILSTSMYLLLENGQRSTTELRKQILALSEQYVRQLTEDMENRIDEETIEYHDLSKPIAVVLYSLLKRIEYLEKQVNLTLEETMQLQELQKSQNCSISKDSSLHQYSEVNIVQPEKSWHKDVIDKNTLNMTVET